MPAHRRVAPTRHGRDHRLQPQAGLKADEVHDDRVALIQRFGPADKINVQRHGPMPDGPYRSDLDGMPGLVGGRRSARPTGLTLRAERPRGSSGRRWVAASMRCTCPPWTTSIARNWFRRPCTLPTTRMTGPTVRRPIPGSCEQGSRSRFSNTKQGFKRDRHVAGRVGRHATAAIHGAARLEPLDVCIPSRTTLARHP